MKEPTMKQLQNQLIDQVCNERDELKAENERLARELTETKAALEGKQNEQ